MRCASRADEVIVGDGWPTRFSLVRIVGTEEVVIVYRGPLSNIVYWLLVIEVEEKVVPIVLRGSSSHAGRYLLVAAIWTGSAISSSSKSVASSCSGTLCCRCVKFGRDLKIHVVVFSPNTASLLM